MGARRVPGRATPAAWLSHAEGLDVLAQAVPDDLAEHRAATADTAGPSAAPSGPDGPMVTAASPRASRTTLTGALVSDTLRAKLAHELGYDRLAAAVLLDVEQDAHDVRERVMQHRHPAVGSVKHVSNPTRR